MDDSDFFLGGMGGKSAAFPQIGSIVEGVIVSPPKIVQQTKMGTGELLFFDNGQARMQAIVTLQTDLRDPDDPQDEGLRTLYVKNLMQKAIGKAMVESGARKLEVGGFLQVGHNATVKSKTAGMQPMKDYVAKYTPPAVQAASVFFDDVSSAPVRPDPTNAPPRADATNAGPNVIFNQHEPIPARAAPVPAGTTLDQLKATSFNGRGEPQSAEIPF